MERKSRQVPVEESQQRGTLRFPIQYNVCSTSNPFYDLWLHWHNEFEIIHVLEGTYNMFIADHELILEKGDLCFIPGKVIHGDAQDKGNFTFESIVFDIEMIRLRGFEHDEFISDILNGKIIPDNKISSEHTEITSTAECMFRTLSQKEPGFEMISAGCLLALFGTIKKAKLYSNAEFLSLKQQIRARKINSVLEFIKENYSRDLSLKDLAESAGFSEKYFCKLFHEITHKAPFEYLNWFRINRACSLLRETDEKLKDISEKCGFNDFSYFIKIFGKNKGMTPHKYRKQSEQRFIHTQMPIEHIPRSMQVEE